MPDEGAWFMYVVLGRAHILPKVILTILPSYYSAGTSDTLDNQKLHVLKGSSNIIWDSEWSYAGRIVIPNRDVWAIDGTVLVYGDNRYLVYSSWDGVYQCLWIRCVRRAVRQSDLSLNQLQPNDQRNRSRQHSQDRYAYVRLGEGRDICQRGTR